MVHPSPDSLSLSTLNNSLEKVTVSCFFGGSCAPPQKVPDTQQQFGKCRAEGGACWGMVPMEFPRDGSQQGALPAAHLAHDAHQHSLQGNHVIKCCIPEWQEGQKDNPRLQHLEVTLAKSPAAKGWPPSLDKCAAL